MKTMAYRQIRRATRAKMAFFSPLSSYHRSETLTMQSSNTFLHPQPVAGDVNYMSWQARDYIAEMRKVAFEGNILRLLRSEIQRELDRSPFPQPEPTFNSFVVDERPGEQWMRLHKQFQDKEEINVEVNMLDGSAPFQKSGGIAKGDNVEVFISAVIDICKMGVGDILEFECSVWPDSLEIENISIHRRVKSTSQHYPGPSFKELDDDLQKSLYDFLDARGINDQLAEFLHKYIQNKRRKVYIRWVENVKSFVERK